MREGYMGGVILGLYWGYKGIMEKKMETTLSTLALKENFGRGRPLACCL